MISRLIEEVPSTRSEQEKQSLQLEELKQLLKLQNSQLEDELVNQKSSDEENIKLSLNARVKELEGHNRLLLLQIALLEEETNAFTEFASSIESKPQMSHQLTTPSMKGKTSANIREENEMLMLKFEQIKEEFEAYVQGQIEPPLLVLSKQSKNSSLSELSLKLIQTMRHQ